MYLFILETIGTQELILVGMVALIVFGPRKLPEMARKAGKMMRELRSVSNEFKSTWSQEVADIKSDVDQLVDVDPENSILGNGIDDDQSDPPETEPKDSGIMPEVREVSEEDFKKLVEKSKAIETPQSDKQDWL